MPPSKRCREMGCNRFEGVLNGYFIADDTEVSEIRIDEIALVVVHEAHLCRSAVVDVYRSITGTRDWNRRNSAFGIPISCIAIAVVNQPDRQPIDVRRRQRHLAAVSRLLGGAARRPWEESLPLRLGYIVARQCGKRYGIPSNGTAGERRDQQSCHQ